MNESLEEGLLKIVRYKGKKIGLIAAVRTPFLGHDGIYFNEIVIDEHFLGIGLAKSIQKKFLIENALKKDFVWGTIDDQNKPSLRTALSNGRKDIRFETFISIKGE